jgi:hypothetical protein
VADYNYEPAEGRSFVQSPRPSVSRGMAFEPRPVRVVRRDPVPSHRYSRYEEEDEEDNEAHMRFPPRRDYVRVERREDMDEDVVYVRRVRNEDLQDAFARSALALLQLIVRRMY